MSVRQTHSEYIKVKQRIKELKKLKSTTNELAATVVLLALSSFVVYGM